MTGLVLQQFGFTESDYTLHQYGSGLINDTWLVEIKKTAEKFILQKINHTVFRSPEDIAFNIRLIGDHMKKFHPDYLFVAHCWPHSKMRLRGRQKPARERLWRLQF